jgi:3-dehydroquinate synthase
LVRVSVPVPGRPYEVTVGAGVLETADRHLPPLPRAERAFVVADAPVAERYLEPLASGLRAAGLQVVHIGVPEGEEAKSLAVYAAVLRQLAVQEAHRDDLVVALGGGAVGDLAGFVAATYMRGVPFLQVPTTLTAQVDAAIGGKTGVNLPEGKNLVGAFHQPVAVLADVGTLASLPERAYRSGLAEVAKYALTLDTGLLERLERDPGPVLARDPGALEDLVARCVRAKAGVVAADERDTGARLVLNYGHTLGHALERLEAFRGRSHGEAIAVGMRFAARLSERMGLAREGLAARHVRLLASLGLETAGELPSAGEILGAMRMDKKYAGGLRFVLLEDVGRPRVVEDVPTELVVAVLVELGAGAADGAAAEGGAG